MQTHFFPFGDDLEELGNIYSPDDPTVYLTYPNIYLLPMTVRHIMNRKE